MASLSTDGREGPRTSRQERRGNGRSLFATVCAVLIMVAGAALVLYPIVTQSISSWIQTHAAQSYSSEVSAMPEKRILRLRRSAEAYNIRVLEGKTPHANLDDNSYLSDSDYMGQMSVESGTDAMIGRVIIPKISVDLPIRHGTSQDSLNDGVGHLYGTSLPIGGKGTNSVLAAHRGLPTAMLFTRLDELRKGDIFYIQTLGRKMAYRVDAIWTVSPTDTSHFVIDPNKDQVTLLTCTPYGVNTERLLVRGTRTALPTQVQTDDGIYPAWVDAGLVFGVVLLIGFGIAGLRARRWVRGQHRAGR